MTATVTIRTHYQISEEEREKRGVDCVHDRGLAIKQRQRRRASYLQRDKRGRITRFCGVSIMGPGWLMPKLDPVLTTVTGSIVWGIYGRMADMPEY